MKESSNLAGEPRSRVGRLQGQDAYERLLEEIRRGDLKPGARLTETEIASRLNISRTPVREAIRRLEADGLVAHEPRSGATVRTLDYAEVMELYEMRTVLEGTAARLAARAATDVEMAELEAINEEMREANGDAQRLFALNQDFHRALILAARNRFLVRSANSVYSALMILGRSTLEAPERASAAVTEHAAVIRAIRAGQGGEAEQSMRAHMERAQQARLRLLRTSGSPVPAPEGDNI
ncbi:GntR family transcriptional regulator [Tropicimonas sp. IMCC34011]|uniref:GntR family transcriptional regulator n=1 Tax=Tropicimonas sp. IMCC34011 TaxID=2248759 RepID=UPI000E23F319|nr:GntR family transcriptional regulator [Tropicimonas sp. IMCC34011]